MVVEKLANAKLPRARVSNVTVEKGIVTQLSITIYQKHKKILSICLNESKLTLERILTKLENEATAQKLFDIEWPFHDRIFALFSIDEFKSTGNKCLSKLSINLVTTPKNVATENEKTEIMTKYHNDELFGGHCGIKKLIAKITPHYYWKGMSRDITRFVKNCTSCKMAKPTNRNKEPMMLTKTPQKPFDIVEIDTIGPLPRTINGNVYAVTILCQLSKYLVTIPIIDKSAKEVARAIFTHFILIYGPMKRIQTDAGTEYKNELLAELCRLLKVDQKFATAYHHQTMGCVERNHRGFNEYIRIYLEGYMSDWDTYLGYFTFAYNIQKSSALKEKYSPYELVFSKRPNVLKDILNGRIEPINNIENFVQEARFRLQTAHRTAVQLVEKLKCTNKKYYDKNSNPLVVKKGQLVKIAKEPYNKFKPIYDGPFEVLDIEPSNLVVKIKNKGYRIHKDRVRLY